MTESYYNASADGLGIEGFLNWANLTVEGWLVSAFLFFIWLSSIYVLNKSEWKLSNVSAFSFFICLISSMIFNLFTTVNLMVIFIISFGLAGSILWSIIER